MASIVPVISIALSFPEVELQVAVGISKITAAVVLINFIKKDLIIPKGKFLSKI